MLAGADQSTDLFWKQEKKKENQEEPMSLKGFGNLMYLLLTSAFEKQYRRATRKPQGREGSEKKDNHQDLKHRIRERHQVSFKI